MGKGIKNFCPNCDEEYDGAPDGYAVTLLPCPLHEHAAELLGALEGILRDHDVKMHRGYGEACACTEALIQARLVLNNLLQK